MVALLDVNVLVALFDPVHAHHELAHQWFDRNRQSGWASCPLTENGLVRVISNSAYPGRRTTPQDAIERLTRFRESGDHAFWPDSASLCDGRDAPPSPILLRRFENPMEAGGEERHQAQLDVRGVASQLSVQDQQVVLRSGEGELGRRAGRC